MARSKNEKVIDGYLGDLPESIQSDVMEIHKLVIKTVNEILNTRDYSDLKNDKWAKEQLEEFCIMPADRSDVGSIRVYQKGKKYRCMIQLTGHFTNHMDDFNQELMHEFIKNVFVTVRPKIRKKYDFTITNEGDHGNPFEGFDVFPNPKLVEEIWNKLSDRKIRTVMEESTEDYFEDAEYDEFTEKSHGKLKYDFRYGFDLNTGHKVKVVYSLDNINVTMGGHGYDIDDSHDNNTVNKNIRSSKEVTSEIERNIRKKGDLDHASKGQKILAIVDRKTGEKLDKCRLIGIGTNNPIFGTTGAHSNVEINPKYLKDIQNDYKHIPEIHVGDVETESSFKTTHAFKEKDLIKHEEDWFGDTVYKDSINERLRGVETLKNGRGSKIDDAQPKYFGLGPTTYNHPSKKDIKKNPELYNKESVDEFDDIDLFEEKSNGKLKYSFRVAINVENGHMIKIVFDLNPDSILQIGDHANRGGRDHVKDAMIKKNIQKNGFNDFSSQALVKAIVDMDTKQNLKSVKTIGVIGSNYNTTRFSVPEKYVDKKLGENASSFTAYPVATREKIAKELNLINAKDAITFTVGEYEKRPSYKATTATNSVTQVYNNQWKQGRGYVDSKKALFGSGLNNQLTRSNMHITTAVKMIEDRYNKIKSVAMKVAKNNDDIDDLCRSFESGLKRIKQTIENNKDENYGQTPSDSRYSKRIDALTDIISEIEDIIKNTNKNESAEFTESSIQYNRVSGKLKDLPKGFQDYAIETNEDILEDVLAEMQRHKDFDSLDDDDVEELINWMDAKSNEDGYGYFFIEKDKDDKNFAGEMRLFPKTGKQFGYISKKLESIWDKSLKYVFDKKHAAINKKDPTKKLTLVTDENLYTLVFVFSKEYAEKLYNYCINPRRFPLTESTSNEENESYNVDMSESEAKKTLGTLTQSIINDKKPVSQYTANIYANIITKNLLPIWAKGYRKLSITIDDDNKNFTVFEFKIPTMTQDFVARFINGRETVTGLLHRNPEIRIKMSSRLFNTIKDRNDAYNFFKAAIKYYDSQAEKYSMKMMSEVMKLNHEMKHLVSNTKLSALVTYPMTLLFAFDDLDMSSKDCFKIDQSDIAAVNKFVKGIYTNYASPEKEKKQIINDLHSVVKALKESLEMDDNLRNILYLPEAVDTLLNGGFDNEINKVHNQFIHENTDTLWPNSSPDPQVKYLAEKFGVKKLKKIPTDLIAYIQIETESIKDSNDKMMIASYCLSKIEIVEWYIELLEVGSKKYIVPHTKQYLETVRTQLLQCYKEIMAVKIKNPNDRPIIDIKYPKGYEG